MAEQQQLAQEISSAISNPVGFSDDVDEDELLRELQELQEQDIEDELLNIPAAPSHNLPQTSNKGKIIEITIFFNYFVLKQNYFF